MLIDAEDFAIYMGVTFTSAEETRAELLLTNVQGVVQRYCNLVQLEEIEDDEIVLRGSYSAAIILPRGPVTAVSEVTVDAAVVTDYDVVGDTIIRTGMDDQVSELRRPRGIHWGGSDIVLGVTYTHGFATPPAEVLSVIYDLAAGAWANPTSVRSHSQTIDGYSDSKTYIGGRAASLTDDHKATLSDYHRSTRSADIG